MKVSVHSGKLPVCMNFTRRKKQKAIVDDLLKKYPDAPGFIKFKCRFVMERLEEVKDFSEAEKFLAYCLKHFPQDGILHQI